VTNSTTTTFGRVSVTTEELSALPTVPDHLLARLVKGRNLTDEEMVEIDKEVSKVVKAVREAGCAKLKRSIHRQTSQAGDARFDDSAVRAT
jgi:hypothetical protein